MPARWLRPVLPGLFNESFALLTFALQGKATCKGHMQIESENGIIHIDPKGIAVIEAPMLNDETFSIQVYGHKYVLKTRDYARVLGSINGF